MKKIGLLLLVLVMLLSFTSCKNEEVISEEENIKIEDMTQDELFYEFVKPLITHNLIGTKAKSVGIDNEIQISNYIQAFQIFTGLSGDYLLETYEAVPTSVTYMNYDSVYIPFDEFTEEISSRYNVQPDFFDIEKNDLYGYSQEKDAVIVPVNYNYRNAIVESNVDKESIKIEKEGDNYKLLFDYHYTNYTFMGVYDTGYHYETYTYTIDIINDGDNYLIDSVAPKINKIRLSNEAVQTIYLEQIKFLLPIDFSQNAIENFYTQENFSKLILTIEKLYDKNYTSAYNAQERKELYDENTNLDIQSHVFSEYFTNANKQTFTDYLSSSEYYDEMYDIIDVYPAQMKELSFSNSMIETNSYTIDEDILTVEYTLSLSDEVIKGKVILEINDITFSIISNEVIERVGKE